MADPADKTYAGRFEGAYTLFPDNAASVDVSGGNATFTNARTIFVGSAGTVTVTPWGGGSNVQFTVPAGGCVPVRVSAVMQSGTSATGLVSVW